MFEIKPEVINRYLIMGCKGFEMHRELFEYYESQIIPGMLEKFLKSIKSKPLQKALESAELSEYELNKYYALGYYGNESYRWFYESYHDFKVNSYINDVIAGKSEANALKNSNLSESEFEKLKESLDDRILHRRMDIVKREILADSTTDKAAKKAGVSFDDIYDWYYKGKSEEEFSEFSEFFFDHYIEPNVLFINDMIGNGHPIDKILKVFDINLTQRDFDIWQREGLIDNEDILINLDRDKKEDDEDKKEFKLNKRDGYN